MNNYPEWWSSTVTVYNKYTDPVTKKVSWFPHVIEGCFYSQVKDRITFNNSVIEADSTKCRIRVSDDFINKKDWNNLSDDEKMSKFTLAAGDIIIAGEVDDVVDEYTKGDRSSDLIAKYNDWPGCFIIETVAINVGPGRGNEHYSAKGK